MHSHEDEGHQPSHTDCLGCQHGKHDDHHEYYERMANIPGFNLTFDQEGAVLRAMEGITQEVFNTLYEAMLTNPFAFLTLPGLDLEPFNEDDD